jgi:hypothetical protein
MDFLGVFQGVIVYKSTPRIIGWVDIGIGTKGKWGFVVSLEKVWEIAIKVSLINRPLSQRSLL